MCKGPEVGISLVCPRKRQPSHYGSRAVSSFGEMSGTFGAVCVLRWGFFYLDVLTDKTASVVAK